MTSAVGFVTRMLCDAVAMLHWRLRSACLTCTGAALIFGANVALAQSERIDTAQLWPQIRATTRPWARWWWFGDAVDAPNLQRQLSEFHHVGLGGVEICPTYGAQGYEKRFIPFLSPQWMEMLAVTFQTAGRFGLGVDLTQGTGWPMGGPWITPVFASTGVELANFEIKGGASFGPLRPGAGVECVVAAAPGKKPIDLTAQLCDGRSIWTAPGEGWKIYTLTPYGPVKDVERAAPGGEGWALDPFSTRAMDTYLARFDTVFTSFHSKWPNAWFHDSYEYHNAAWTPEFFEDFERRRGYDLRSELPALCGDGPLNHVARVKYDYRRTIAELHQAYVKRWTDWAHTHGSMTREQAHGSPANVEDVYATADIPETEIFRKPEMNQQPMLEFAASAAHVSGRNLVSAESFTWLGEHFQVSLADLKPAADFLFLSGVNRLVLAGTPYSPSDAIWPGWQFYASVNFGPDGGLWRDLPAFLSYATRCQSILQSGRADNDVLLYFPIHDFWQSADGLVQEFGTNQRWMFGTDFYDVAMALARCGYGYDEITDHFLAEAQVDHGAIRVGGNVYRAVVIPACRLLPPDTLRQLLRLAQGGGTVVVHGDLPQDVPGLGGYEERRRQLRALLAGIKEVPVSQSDMRAAVVMKGRFVFSSDTIQALAEVGIPRETMTDYGLRFIRRREADGYDYFVVNRGQYAVKKWITFRVAARSVALLDPLTGMSGGVRRLIRDNQGRPQVYLAVPAQSSLIVRTFDEPKTLSPEWIDEERSQSQPIPVDGRWTVRFVDGGPVLPRSYETSKLKSWTGRDDDEARRFCGTALYRTAFMCDPSSATDWQLDLGRVCESARVRLNGHPIGTLWSQPFQIRVGKFLRPGRNDLEVEVTNIAANRISDMDRRHVHWKYFDDLNVVSPDYRPFDASHWALRDSGLLGPVVLYPMVAAPRP